MSQPPSARRSTAGRRPARWVAGPVALALAAAVGGVATAASSASASPTSSAVLAHRSPGAQHAPDERLRGPASPALAMALFDRWNAALATGDPAKVNALYARDAVLLPTVAGEVHDLPQERVRYFTEFLKLKPQGTWVEPKIRILSSDALVLSGLYDFAVVRNGKPETIHARATFVFTEQRGVWRIVEHHSSKVPV